MNEKIVEVDHYSASIMNKIGEGARILGALRDAGVNFTAMWAYPSGSGKAQLEMIPEDSSRLVKAAKEVGLALGKKQQAFFASGEDRPGAVAELLAKLAAEDVNVGAVQAVCAGAGRYGVVIFLPQKEIRKAAKALGIS